MRVPNTLLLSSALLSGCLLLPGQAQAHFFPESANCKAPAMPLEFVTELDKKQFDAKVAQYRDCLESFVNKQNEAMAKHKQAAEKAAADWKSYAENVLKAKVTPADGTAPATGATQ